MSLLTSIQSLSIQTKFDGAKAKKLHLEFKNADWTTFENEGRSIADLGVSMG